MVSEFSSKDMQINENLSAIFAQRAAYESIDNILIMGTDKIENLTTKLTTFGISASEKKHCLGKISLLSCMMKRECMLSLNVFYRQNQPIGILQNAFGELSEFCTFSDITIAFRFAISGDIPSSQALKMYSFFATALERAIDINCKNILAQIYKNNSGTVFSVLADKSLFNEKDFEGFLHRKDNLKIECKNWEDTQNYILNFYDEAIQKKPYEADENINEKLEKLHTEREFIRISTQVHDVLSQRLTAIQRISQNSDFTDYTDLLALSKDAITQIKIRQGGNASELFGDMYFFFRKIGLSIELLNALPKNNSISFLILAVLREACTNAIKHAGATKVYVKIKQDAKNYRIEITNNGTSPKQGLVEGGGLFGIRSRVENAGGTLKVEVIPKFSLIINISEDI